MQMVISCLFDKIYGQTATKTLSSAYFFVLSAGHQQSSDTPLKLERFSIQDKWA